MADQPVELTEDEIAERLASRPNLMDRLKNGDSGVLAELIEVGTGAKVVRTTTRGLA